MLPHRNGNCNTAVLTDSPPPFSAEAERAVILSAIAEPVAARLAFSEVAESDFTLPLHRNLWPLLQQFFNDHDNIEELLLVGHLQAINKIGDVGGKEAIGRFFFDAALRTAANIESEIALLKGFSQRRRLHHTAINLYHRSHNISDNPAEILNDLSSDMAEQLSPVDDDLDKETWPEPLAPDALYGIAGDAVTTFEPHSEADPSALLLQFLTAFGNCIDRGAHWRVSGDDHYTNLFVVLVGKSAKGRKGTSWGEIRRLFDGVGENWEGQVKSGLSSAEGLIWQCRDPISKTDLKTGQTEIVDPGVDDKRLLLLEPEFSSVLKQAQRTGNTLSPLIRQAWERGNLESLTKNTPAKSTGAHISIIGHITKQELLKYLTDTESGNGFANRFLFACVRRSKLLPFGGRVNESQLAVLRGRLINAVEFASRAILLECDPAAAALWREIYGTLAAERDGLAAIVCGRAEAQTLRLAMLYALLDEAECIRVEHLKAGLAVWNYCERSAYFIFGDALGDSTADEILEALKRSQIGITRTEIFELFKRHKSSAEISRALGLIEKAGRASRVMLKTAGRSAERWQLTTDSAKKAKEAK